MLRIALFAVAIACAWPLAAQAQSGTASPTEAAPPPPAQTAAPPKQTASPAKQAAPSPAVSPADAQQVLGILKDDKKRAALISTLETIVRVEPSAPKPADNLPITLKPGSVGAQVLVGAGAFLDHLTYEARGLVLTLENAPSAWDGFAEIAEDPSRRQELWDVAWRLTAIMACGLVGEFAVRRLLRAPLARVKRAAPEDAREDATDAHRDEVPDDAPGGVPPEPPAPGAGDASRHGAGGAARRHRVRATSWTLLRRFPLALARLGLELLPIVAFLLIAHVIAGTSLGGSERARLILLALVDAYAGCEGLIAFGRMMFSPDSVGLRLLRVSDSWAAYAMRWLRRLVSVVVFGVALASVGLVLGITEETYNAALKLVGLIVHLMLIVIVLETRAAVAHRLRAPPDSHGFIAGLRNGAAAIWHWVALFYLVAAWLVWAVELPDGFQRLIHVIWVTLAVLLAARLALIVLQGTLDRLMRHNADHPGGLDGRLDAYRPILRAIVSGVVYSIAVLGLFEGWGLGTLDWLIHTAAGVGLLSTLASLAVTVAIALGVWEFANTAVARHLARLTRGQQAARSARLRTLLPLLRTTLMVTLIVIVGLMVLSDIGVNIAPLLAGAGVLGIAIGFGSQKLVQDVITGLFLLLENAMQVGDVVTVGGLSGVVEYLSIRSIRLRSEDGSVQVIPFSSVTTVTNMTRDFSYAVITASVSYDDDYDEVVAVMKEIVSEMRAEPRWASEIRDDIEVWGLDQFGASSINIKVRIRCGPFGRWAVQREFNRRMKLRFDEHGIEIPYPHQKLIVDPELFGQPAPAAPATPPAEQSEQRRAAE